MEKENKELRLYLDEDVPPLLAQVLRERGFDAVSAHEAGKRKLTDRDQLMEAAAQGRVLLTHNIRDFARIHHEFGGRHCGIVFANQQPFSSLLRRALRFLRDHDALEMKGGVYWLSAS